jgi:hypothetical protein
VYSPPQAEGTREALSEVLKNLATLLGDDRAVYLRLGPEAAVMSVKGRETVAFGDAIGVRWQGMTPEERVEALLEWTRKAAEYCRKPRARWVRA